ncbi:DUF1194 domain-containing protein [Hasllibacter halocynthiae]|nr:DUF1194 domain-containing protein [Hasllibacter halocynthiae]
MRAAALLLCCLALPARACGTALLLLMDVSGSVDRAEWRLQSEGLAAALEDPAIAEIMTRERNALAVVQWSGTGLQRVAIPWTVVDGPAALAALAERARTMPRSGALDGTAPAEALAFGLRLMAGAPECGRRVIDVSGDGTPNGGGDVRPLPREAEAAGITINGLAIEALGPGLPVTNFYRAAIRTRDGFVMTARGHRDFPAAIRRKILREISRVTS